MPTHMRNTKMMRDIITVKGPEIFLQPHSMVDYRAQTFCLVLTEGVFVCNVWFDEKYWKRCLFWN
jgi:hypothetical protein